MPKYSPPLRGDGRGVYKIHIVGNCGTPIYTSFLCPSRHDAEPSGTGKSTLGAYLSGKLNIPHIPLDEVAWKPGWQETPEDELKETASAFMAQYTKGWIIDGNYRVLGMLVPDDATDIIWLDPPLYYYFPRLLLRTFSRLFGVTPPCAEGCLETWGGVFSSKGIVWFCLTHHRIAKTLYTAWRLRMGVEAGGKMLRLDESRGELAAWKNELELHLLQ